MDNIHWLPPSRYSLHHANGHPTWIASADMRAHCGLFTQPINNVGLTHLKSLKQFVFASRLRALEVTRETLWETLWQSSLVNRPKFNHPKNENSRLELISIRQRRCHYDNLWQEHVILVELFSWHPFWWRRSVARRSHGKPKLSNELCSCFSDRRNLERCSERLKSEAFKRSSIIYEIRTGWIKF